MKRIRKVSGQIACRIKRDRNSWKDYWNQFLTKINELTVFRKERYGCHLYSGGKIFSVGKPIEQKGYAKLTAGFRDSKPYFVDLLFDVSTRDFETCDISFFLRDQALDFESIMKNLRSQCSNVREEANGNFCTMIRNDGKMLRLSGYPSMNILTISRSFTRGGLQPSQFLDKFIEMNLHGN
jgi:hypothetical protein